MTRVIVYSGPYLALIALIAAVVSGLGHRLDWWSFASGFAILKWAVYCAIIALAVSTIGIFFTRPSSGQSGFVWPMLAFTLSAVLVSVPSYWLYRAKQLPRIHDVTTDTVDPPQFAAVLPFRDNTDNSLAYAGEDIARQQWKAYPDITSMLLSSRPVDTFDRALDVVHELRWDVVDANRDEMRIEATDTTFWFGFKDDIVIRIRAVPDGSQLDIRSVSRVGLSDVGTNAGRIRCFLKRMQRI